MRKRLFRLASLLAVLGIAASAFAQYGHPLKGSWSGDWGTGEDNRTRLLLQLNWDGEVITGTINPGPNAVPLSEATLDPATWTVHFEAESKNDSGSVVRYVVDGTLENLGSYNRVITGTWVQGTVTGGLKRVQDSRFGPHNGLTSTAYRFPKIGSPKSSVRRNKYLLFS